MTLTTTAAPRKETKQKTTYPCLLRNRMTGTVALCFDDTTATVVVSRGNILLGESFDHSVDTGIWEPYDGTVTLEQKL